jgi:hypothetical protein
VMAHPKLAKTRVGQHVFSRLYLGQQFLIDSGAVRETAGQASGLGFVRIF